MTDDRHLELALDLLEAEGSPDVDTARSDDDLSAVRLAELTSQAVVRRAASSEAPDVDAEWQRFITSIHRTDDAATESVQMTMSEAMPKAERETEPTDDRHGMRHLHWLAAAAVAVLLIAGGVALFLKTDRQPADMPTIAYQPPKSLADRPTITTSTGKTVVLPTRQKNVSIGGLNTKAQQRLLDALGLDKDTPIDEKMTLSVPTGNSSDIVLADGTHVWLYSGSTLTYPVNFGGSQRVVYLQGQALFDVTHNAARPFIIVTDQLTATVLGTELNVSCYNDEPAHVALLNGKVEVEAKNGGHKVVLLPGQGATLNGTLLSTAEESMDTYLYWKEGYLYFDGRPLADIAAQLSRWYKVKVVFDEPRLRSRRYRFFCQRTEPVTRALELLNHFDDVHATLESDGIHIK